MPATALSLWFIEALESHGVSQRELSRRTGVSQAQISKIAGGLTGTEPDTLRRLVAGILGEDADPEEIERLYWKAWTALGSRDGEMPEVTREPYMDELRAEGYHDLDDPIIRALAQKEAGEAYKRTYKSIADAIRDARRLSPGTVAGPSPRDDED